MRKVLTAVAVLAAAATVSVSPAAFAGNDSRADVRGEARTVVGLADDGTTLFTFSVRSPSVERDVAAVRGLVGDSTLVGIDFRVQNGALYGVGNAGGVYIIDLASRAATKVTQLSVPLEGTAFGVDFNPAANALRVVSNTGQNLRQPFATAGAATVADARLTTPPTMGDTLGVEGAAYTNNDTDAATGTTLFDLSTTADNITVQSPANNGTLAATGALTVAAETGAGFDIYTDGDGRNSGFAALTVGGQSAFYTVDVLNGRAAKVGNFDLDTIDIAIPLGQR